MTLLKAPSFPYQKRLHNKAHSNLATEVLKDFSPGALNSVCVTHSKNSNSGNLEPESELIIFFFFKVTLTITVAN